MSATRSTLSLHLRYRLRIAEMNADLTILRIFDDHLAELEPVNDPGIKKAVDEFRKQFAAARKEIDELKHEMHLVKMKLAARTRHGKKNADTTADNHTDLAKRYTAFRKTFDNLKKDFVEIDVND